MPCVGSRFELRARVNAHAPIPGVRSRALAQVIIMAAQTWFRLWRSSVHAALVLVRLLSLCSAGRLKVGVFNVIPDLNRDRLSSYENMIESGFNERSERYTVDIVVDPTQYSPYGNLQDHLSADGFDIIEMDTYNLRSVVKQDLVVQLPLSLSGDLLRASVDAVTLNGRVYGYPTLVCGMFLTSFTTELEDCPLTHSLDHHAALSGVLEQCRAAMLADDAHDWERLVGGRMNYDGMVWYPELLYLDGYIDVHGPQSLDQAINDLLLREVVDSTLCERLSHFIGHCSNIRDSHENRCYDSFPESYTDSLSNVINDLEEYRTYLHFGFLEKVSYLNPESLRMPITAIPVSMGEENNLLLFTDALVVNRARWTAASAEKQTAIRDFIRYFTSSSLREKIAMGVDLSPPRPRWLLQAQGTFYKHTTLPLYRSLHATLSQAVAAPSLTPTQSSLIHNILTNSCLNISRPAKSLYSLDHENVKEEL